MSLTDRDRRDLFAVLEQQLGTGPATTLMELLPATGWSDLARRSDIDRLDARIEGLDARIDRLDARIDRLGARIDRQFARMVWVQVVTLLSAIGATAGLVGL